MLCIFVMKPFFYPYIVSLVVLRNICRYFIGMTDKARQAIAFCLGIGKPFSLRSGLPLPYMLGLIYLFFPFMHVGFFFFFFLKKGLDARFLLKFSAISCMFIYFNSYVCFDRICLHIIKFVSLICAELSCCIFTR